MEFLAVIGALVGAAWAVSALLAICIGIILYPILLCYYVIKMIIYIPLKIFGVV